jgi:threonine/homoserine/homoserine lactone efflux protein
MELSNYLIYLSISVIASISVGPSVVLAANNGINFGWKKALSGVVGHVCAILILAIISASGVGSIIIASEMTFLLIKYLGVLYLAYIGYAIWHNKGTWSLLNEPCNVPSGLSLYRKSLLLGLSNPKALVFFTALFPQFINAEQALLPQFFLLTSTSLANALIFTFAYSLAGYNFKNRLIPMLNSGLLSKVTGTLFLCFATMLAVTT